MKTLSIGILAASLILPVAARAGNREERRGEKMEKQGEKREKRAEKEEKAGEEREKKGEAEVKQAEKDMKAAHELNPGDVKSAERHAREEERKGERDEIAGRMEKNKGVRGEAAGKQEIKDGKAMVKQAGGKGGNDDWNATAAHKSPGRTEISSGQATGKREQPAPESESGGTHK